jgi:hypothetical protein
MVRPSALAAILMLVAARGGFAASAPSIGATLSPTEETYVVGDPVELNLTITNNWTETVGCAADYPSFREGQHTGITIRPAGPLRGDQTQASMEEVRHDRVSIIPVKPGESWSVKVYLSRFLKSIGVGTQRLQYSIDLDCVGENLRPSAWPNQGGFVGDSQRPIAATGKGEFVVNVLYDADGRLPEVVKKYGRSVDSDPEFWGQRSAAEALSVIDSPLVIPYLKPALDWGWADLRVLVKFRGNPDAEELLKSRVRTGKFDQFYSVLALLQQWQYVLDAADFATLLTRGGMDLKIAAFRYAESAGNLAYVPAVEAYAGDSNAAVAKEARRVADSLRATGR